MSNVDEVTLPSEGMIDAKVIVKFLGISASMWSKLNKLLRTQIAGTKKETGKVSLIKHFVSNGEDTTGNIIA